MRFAVGGGLGVNGRPGQVPLDSVATPSVESGPSRIDRYDRRRCVTISADLGGMPLGDAMGFRQPMAIAVIGGLLTSTLLSLLMVPVVFSDIDGLRRYLTGGVGHAGRVRAAESVA